MYASEGGVVELKVYVTGNPQPDVYWRKGTNRDIDTRQGKYIIVDDSSLKVSNVLTMYTNQLQIFKHDILYGNAQNMDSYR